MLPTKHPALLASHWRYWLSQGLSMAELSQVAGISLPPTERVPAPIVNRLYCLRTSALQTLILDCAWAITCCYRISARS